MARHVGMHEAKTTLSKLVERAQAGEDIILERSGTPVARIVPIAASRVDRAATRGAWKGRVEIASDFDELDDDLQRAFGMIE